jgi:pimeloyl-ACP methyl ester carboxylesterase
VGFDPRGVGASTAVRCFTPYQLDSYYSIDSTPDDAFEYKRWDLAQYQFAQACKLNSGKLLGHIGTRDAARDIDVLRAALGERKLTYLGFSYGTLLGATYAELFPKRIRAMVLDGAIDPAKTNAEENSGQHQAFGTAFVAFLQDCLKTKGCPFKTHKIETAGKKFDAFFKRIDKAPLNNTYDGRQVTQPIVLTGIQSALYSPASWPDLRQAFAEGFKGSGETFLRLADSYHERRTDGTYSNSGDAFIAVNCMDYPEKKLSPKHKGKIATDPCNYWPVKGKPIIGAVHARGAAPIMVVGTTRDPATPYRDAKDLAKELSSGFLVSYDGDGHTAYHRGSACVDQTVDRYLINLTVPKKDPHC